MPDTNTCEVVMMHIAEHVVDDNNRINPHKLDLMGRLGRAYYVRASGDAIQTIVQSVTEITIGYDKLLKVQNSSVLRGNELGMLAELSKYLIQVLLKLRKKIQK